MLLGVRAALYMAIYTKIDSTARLTRVGREFGRSPMNYFATRVSATFDLETLALHSFILRGSLQLWIGEQETSIQTKQSSALETLKRPIECRCQAGRAATVQGSTYGAYFECCLNFFPKTKNKNGMGMRARLMKAKVEVAHCTPRLLNIACDKCLETALRQDPLHAPP